MKYQIACEQINIDSDKLEFTLGKTHLFNCSEDGILLLEEIMKLGASGSWFTPAELELKLPKTFDYTCDVHVTHESHVKGILDFFVECTVLRSKETPLFEVADNDEARKIVLTASIVGGASSSILNPTSPV